MRPLFLASLLAILLGTMLQAQSTPVDQIRAPFMANTSVPRGLSPSNTAAQATIGEKYGKLPLNFEANRGQADRRVMFLSHTGSYSLFLTEDEAVLAFGGKKSSSVLRMKLRKANSGAKVTGMDQLAGTSNYFIGNDPTKWRSKVPTYAKVKYEGVYPGIDLVYYGNQRQLEYDFIVAPGADPHHIAFDVSGSKGIRTDARGDLLLKMNDGEIRWHKPVVYQEKGGVRQEIAACYAISATNRVAFDVAKYDANRPLYIDPLIYSTYLGGRSLDEGKGIAVDSEGDAYVTGYTFSSNFPIAAPIEGGNHGQDDAFVAKINSSGSALVYSTYLGGTGHDSGSGIAVDKDGNAYVTGTTQSGDFPTTSGAFQLTNRGTAGNTFVTKIDPTGSFLVYSTYLGGNNADYGAGIAVDSTGNAYVTGTTTSSSFPILHPLQGHLGGMSDAFVSELNPTGSALVYSSFLGGSNADEGVGIALDTSGNVYVSGETSSTDFPTLNPLQPNYGGGNGDVFVAKINGTGSAFIYSTYLGGSLEDGFNGGGIAVDTSGNAYITGSTCSPDFPNVNPVQGVYGGSDCSSAGYGDAFVSKIDSSGANLVYSTYLGGSQADQGLGIAVDQAGDAYVVGFTSSPDFPTTRGAFQTVCRSCFRFDQAFLAELNPAGSALGYATYLGGGVSDHGVGIALDGAGGTYVTGFTHSRRFPLTGALQAAIGGQGDAFVSRFHLTAATATTISSSPNPSTYGQPVTLTAMVTSTMGTPPDGDTVEFENGGRRSRAGGTLINGVATASISTLRAGTNQLKATYAGDSNFDSSTSTLMDQQVRKAGTTITLVSSPNPSQFRQGVGFTATVSAAFGGTATGSVTFYADGRVLQTRRLHGEVAGGGTSRLKSGTHTITAIYHGRANFSSSSTSLIQTVN